MRGGGGECNRLAATRQRSAWDGALRWRVAANRTIHHGSGTPLNENANGTFTTSAGVR